MRTTSQFQEVGSGLQSRPDEQQNPNLQPPLPGLDKIVKPFRFAPSPYVYKVVPLREARTPDQMTLCDTCGWRKCYPAVCRDRTWLGQESRLVKRAGSAGKDWIG